MIFAPTLNRCVSADPSTYLVKNSGGARPALTHHRPTAHGSTSKRSPKCVINSPTAAQQQERDQIRKLCGLHKVKSLFAFRSVLSDGFKSDSDIDRVVDINANDPLTYSYNYFNLKFQLEKMFNREKVVLLEGHQKQ